MTVPFRPDNTGWFSKIVEPEPEGWLHKILHAHAGSTLQTVGRGEVRSSAAPGPSLASTGRAIRMALGGAAEGVADLPGQIVDLGRVVAPPTLPGSPARHAPSELPGKIGDFVGGKPVTPEDSLARTAGYGAGNVLAWEAGSHSGVLKKISRVGLSTREVGAFKEVEPAAFDAALKQLVKEKPSEAGFITWRTPEEMQAEGMRTFLGHDGKVGYAIHPETGDIRNVFNAGGPKGAGAAAVADAVQNGGKILDAFDTRLTDIYRDLGFKETWRSKWADEFRPAMWDEAKHGTPDVIGMEYAGGTSNPDEILAAYQKNRAARRPKVAVQSPEPELVPAGAPKERGFGLDGYIPEQQPLEYYYGERTDPRKLMDAYQMSREAFDHRGPFRDFVEAGRKYPGAAPWYDTREIYRDAADVLGPDEAAKRVNALLGGFMPSSTARSAPPSNLKRAFLWQQLAREGAITPEILRTHKVEPAAGFGHFAQNAHQAALARYLETGEMNAAINPKPASFGADLTGNHEVGTFDTVMGRIARLTEPGVQRFLTPGADPTPFKWAYEPLERGLADAAHEAHAAGVLDVPDGLSPVGAYQSLGWHGATRSAEYGSMADIWKTLRKDAAKKWGVSESEANRLIWGEGQTPGLPLDSPALRRLISRR